MSLLKHAPFPPAHCHHPNPPSRTQMETVGKVSTGPESPPLLPPVVPPVPILSDHGEYCRRNTRGIISIIPGLPCLTIMVATLQKAKSACTWPEC